MKFSFMIALSSVEKRRGKTLALRCLRDARVKGFFVHFQSRVGDLERDAIKTPTKSGKKKRARAMGRVVSVDGRG